MTDGFTDNIDWIVSGVPEEPESQQTPDNQDGKPTVEKPIDEKPSDLNDYKN